MATQSPVQQTLDTPKQIAKEFKITVRWHGEYQVRLADILKKTADPKKLALLLEVLGARLTNLPTNVQYAQALLEAYPDIQTSDLWEIVNNIKNGYLTWSEALQEAQAAQLYRP